MNARRAGQLPFQFPCEVEVEVQARRQMTAVHEKPFLPPVNLSSLFRSTTGIWKNLEKQPQRVRQIMTTDVGISSASFLAEKLASKL